MTGLYGIDLDRDEYHVLRHLATRYLADRRASGELRVRLAAIEHDRAEWMEAAERPEHEARARTELAQIERVRLSLARSTDSSAERLHAFESIIAAVLTGARASSDPSLVGPPDFPRPARGASERRSRPPPAAAGLPDASVRGHWSPPSG
jgi:hypothetical protein